MFIEVATCPSCSAEFIVDEPLWRSGIELHCPECAHYFRRPGTADELPAQQVCRASVPIRVWKPDRPR